MSYLKPIQNGLSLAGKLGKAAIRNVFRDPFVKQVKDESKKRKMYEKAVNQTFKLK